MQARARIEERRPPIPPPANDTQEPDVLGAAGSGPRPAQQNELALRNALRQWMIFAGAIGVGLLALVLTLKA
jgi:hypothetical protein